MEPFQLAKDWLEYLASEATFFRENKKPSLFAVKALLDLLGRPDASFEYRIIVGGTAGKGTVCKRIESVLVGEGESVVMLTSPHIQDVRERISINGSIISKDLFAQSLLQIKEVAEQNDIHPTYYEALVVAGCVAGKIVGCKYMIAEVGLGGRWDGVNAFKGKRISAVTFIGDDHRDILGPELTDIAREKASIFTDESVFNISYEQNYRSIFDSESSSEIDYVKGVKQKLNKKIAQKVCKFILKKDFVMTPVSLPARWEVFWNQEQKIILDGSHSIPRFEFIVPKVKKLSKKPTVLFAMAKNHDPKSIESILPYVENIVWTTVSGERDFWDPNDLQKQFKRGSVVEDPQKALQQLLSDGEKNPVLITGSFYLCGALRGKLTSLV